MVSSNAFEGKIKLRKNVLLILVTLIMQFVALSEMNSVFAATCSKCSHTVHTSSCSASVTTQVTCSSCSGTGTKTCTKSTCSNGKIACSHGYTSNHTVTSSTTCSSCSGSGKKACSHGYMYSHTVSGSSTTCSSCSGSGTKSGSYSVTPVSGGSKCSYCGSYSYAPNCNITCNLCGNSTNGKAGCGNCNYSSWSCSNTSSSYHKCSTCGGSGSVSGSSYTCSDWSYCSTCSGSGSVSSSYTCSSWSYCTTCGGDGKISCSTCGGDGLVSSTTTCSCSYKSSASYSSSDKTYNGSSQTGVTGTNVTLSGTTSATNVGSYTAYASPKSYYLWSDGSSSQKTITWSISAKSISGVTVTLGTTSYTYDGSAKQPSVTVKDGTTTLTSGTHYTVSYSNNTNAGTATVTITGKGNYTGTTSKTFTINRAKTASYSSSNKTYNGSSQTGVTGTNVTLSGTTSATNAGNYTAYATPTSNYAWSDGSTSQKTISWSIAAKDVSSLTVTLGTSSYTYDGSAKQPSVTVKDGTTTLTSGTHYTVSYSNNTNAGTATVTITGKGNYTETTSKTFTINRAKTASYSSSNKTYNRSSQTGVTGTNVTLSGTTSTTNVGDYTAYATPTSNYAWSDGSTSQKTINWTISPKSVSSLTVTLGTSSYTYDGSAKQPSVTVKDGTATLTSGTEYTVSYSDNINVGTATVTITGIGNYTETKTATFTINRSRTASYSSSNKTCNGSMQTAVTGVNVELTGSISGLDAGVYRAYAEPTSNYAWSDGTFDIKTITWEMYRTAGTISVEISGDVIFGKTIEAIVTASGEGMRTYQWWYASTSSVTTKTNIESAKTNTYTIAGENVGKYIGCTVTIAQDSNFGACSGEAVSAVPVAKATGSVTVSILGITKYGQTLKASVSTLSDGVKTYKWWYANSSGDTSGTIISGASGDTYTIGSGLVGKYIGCTVNVAEGSTYTACSAGSASATPVVRETGIVTASITPTEANMIKVDSTLTVTPNTLSSGEKTYRWWYSDEADATTGTAITGATSNTYTITDDYVGKYIGCTVNVAESADYTACSCSDITQSKVYNENYAVIINNVETYKVSMLEDAIEKVSDITANVTIKVLKNVIDSSEAVIPSGENITLNTNGKTITKTSHPITNNGTLTLTGSGEITTSDAINLVNNNGSMTVSMTGTLSTTYSGTGYNVINGNGNLIVNNTVTISSTSSDAIMQTYANSSAINISSGTITSAKGGICFKGATLNITGGTITSNSDYVITNRGEGTLNISNATIGNKENMTALDLQSGKTIIVSGNILGSINNDIISNLTIGNSGDAVSISIPKIQSATYGITSASEIDFYDGQILGKTAALNISGIINTPTNYSVNLSTSGEYKIATLVADNYYNARANSYYSTLKDALDNAITGDTIVVNKNNEDSSNATVASGKTITLDLNGKTITKTTNSITNNGNLTITDNSGEEGTITTKEASADNIDVLIRNDGTLTLIKGNIIHKGKTNNNWATIYDNNASSNLIINGGKIVARNNDYNGKALYINNGDVAINSGEIAGIKSYALYALNNGTVTINGGKIHSDTQNTVNVSTNVDLIIKGGEITSDNAKAVYFDSTGTLTIGNLEDAVSTIAPIIKGGTNGINSTKVVNFYDGIISGKTKALNVSGDINTPTNYDVRLSISGDYEEATLVSTNYYNTRLDSYHTTLEDAFNIASSNDTIKVLRNVEDSSSVVVANGKTITLNLNGKTITKTTNAIINNGTLIITDASGEEGTITTKEANAENIEVLIQNSGTLTLTKGNIIHKGKTNNNWATIYDNSASSNFTMNGGKVSATLTTGAVLEDNTYNGRALYLNGGSVAINSGEIAGIKSYAIIGWNDGNYTATVTINGGDIHSDTKKAVCIYASQPLYANVDLIITGGEITSNNDGAVYFDSTGTLTIGNSGDAVSTTAPAIKGGTNGVYSTNGINFYDGIISGKNKALVITGDINAPTNYNVRLITSGEYQEATLVIANYYNARANSYFETLADAVANAANGDTIKLMKNVNDTSSDATISSGKNITINTQTYTLTRGTKTITNSGTLNIIGNGKITSNGNNVIKNEGTLNINDVTLESDSGDYAVILGSKAGNIINVNSGNIVSAGDGINTKTSGTLNINGGKVTSGKVAIKNESTVNINIIDGEIISSGDAITSTNGTVVIGKLDSTVSTILPIIRSESGDAIKSTGNIEFYDGILMSKTNTSVFSGTVSNKPTSHGISYGTKDGYYTVTLKPYEAPQKPIIHASTTTWTNVAPTFTITIGEEIAGSQVVEYKIGNGRWMTYTSGDEITCNVEGVVTIKARATNASYAGLVTNADDIIVRYDKTLPTVVYSVNYIEDKAIINITASDAHSGICNIELSGSKYETLYDGTNLSTYTCSYEATNGTYTITALDAAGNIKVISNIVVDIDVGHPAVSAENINYLEDLIIRYSDSSLDITHIAVTTSNEVPTKTETLTKTYGEKINVWLKLPEPKASGEILFKGLNAGTYYVWAKNSKGTTNSCVVTVNKINFTGTVSILGMNTIGETLLANVSNVYDKEITFTYEWFYNDANNTTTGKFISNGNTLGITESLYNKYIYVIVTAVGNNYNETKVVDITDNENNVTAKVSKIYCDVKAAITGTCETGKTLTVNAATPSSGTKRYQWWYGSTETEVPGKEIEGATNSTFTVLSEYEGKYIGCTVTVDETSRYYSCNGFAKAQTMIENASSTNPSIPIVEAEFNDESGNYESGTWTNKLVNMTISANKRVNAISKFQYSTNKTTWNDITFNISSGIKVSGNKYYGTVSLPLENVLNNTYYFRAVDSTNKISEVSNGFNLRYDCVKPQISVSHDDQTATITLKDDNSGIQYYAVTEGFNYPSSEKGIISVVEGNTLNYWYKVSNTTNTKVVTFKDLTEGFYYAWAEDAAGNVKYTSFSMGADMITTWEIPSSKEITLPISGEQTSVTVDWGDGAVSQNVGAFPTHTYSAAGTYDIKISGYFEKWGMESNSTPSGNYLDAANYVTAVKQFGELSASGYNFAHYTKLKTVKHVAGQKSFKDVTSFENILCDCTELTSVDFSGADLSKITSMEKMMNGDSKLTSVSFSGANISSLRNTSLMFSGCSQLNSISFTNAISGKLENTSNMFNGCSSITQITLTGLDLIAVKDMSYMFDGCSSLTNITWPETITKSLTNMSGMFKDCNDLVSVNLNYFNTSKVTDMSYLFENCETLTNISLDKFETDNVTNMSYMFDGCINLRKVDITGFDTSNVTNMKAMFQNCKTLRTLNLENVDLTKVTDISYFINNAKLLGSILISNNFKVPATCTSIFGATNNLTAIIMVNEVPGTSIFTNAISNLTGKIIYVPTEAAEESFKNAWTNIDASMIHPILELSGDEEVSIDRFEDYEEEYYTVAGFEHDNNNYLSEYGYSSSVINGEIDTDEVGDYKIVYELDRKVNHKVVFTTNVDRLVHVNVVVVAAPEGFEATKDSGDIEVSWTKVLDGDTKYELSARIGNGDWYIINNEATTPYVHTGLEKDTYVQYALRAYNHYGVYSDYVYVTGATNISEIYDNAILDTVRPDIINVQDLTEKDYCKTGDIVKFTFDIVDKNYYSIYANLVPENIIASVGNTVLNVEGMMLARSDIPSGERVEVVIPKLPTFNVSGDLKIHVSGDSVMDKALNIIINDKFDAGVFLINTEITDTAPSLVANTNDIVVTCNQVTNFSGDDVKIIYEYRIVGEEDFKQNKENVIHQAEGGKTYEVRTILEDITGNKVTSKTSTISINETETVLAFETTSPVSGTYPANTNITIKAIFNKSAKITGTPTLTIKFGDGKEILLAGVISADEREIVFTYTTKVEDYGTLTGVNFKANAFFGGNEETNYDMAPTIGGSEIIAKTAVLVKENEVSTYYSEIQEGINAANTSGDLTKIYLLRDEEISSPLVINSNKKIELNTQGKDITCISGEAVTIINHGNLTIVDEVGTTEIIASGETSAVAIENDGTLLIASGQIKAIVASGNATAINNEGTLIIGTDDGEVDGHMPFIWSTEYGIKTTGAGNTYFYDGVIESEEGKSVVGDITIPAGNTLITENIGEGRERTYIDIDKEPPTLDYKILTTTWTNGYVEIEVEAYDDKSGISKVMLNTDEITLTNNKAIVKVYENGEYILYAEDMAKNSRTKSIAVGNIDKAAPVISKIVAQSEVSSSMIEVLVEVKDSKSGLVGVVMSLSGEGPEETDTWTMFETYPTSKQYVKFNIEKDKKYYCYAKDRAGNIGKYAGEIKITEIDKESPVIKKLSIETEEGKDFIIGKEILINISAVDNVRVSEILVSDTPLTDAQAKVADGWQVYNEKIVHELPIGGDKTYTIYVWVKDDVGNISMRTTTSIELKGMLIGDNAYDYEGTEEIYNKATLKFKTKDLHYDMSKAISTDKVILRLTEGDKVIRNVVTGLKLKRVSTYTDSTTKMSGLEYEIEAQNLPSNGDIDIILLEEAMVDLARNKSNAISLETDVTVDNIAPKISIVDTGTFDTSGIEYRNITVTDKLNHLLKAIEVEVEGEIFTYALDKDGKAKIAIPNDAVITAFDKAGNESHHIVGSTKDPNLTIAQSSISLDYGGTFKKVSYTYDGDGALEITTSDNKIATVSYDVKTKQITVTPISVGNCEIVLRSVGTSKYRAERVSLLVEVLPRPVTLSWTNSTFTYDENNHKITATVTNAINGETVFVSGYKNNNFISAGNYTAEAISLNNPNYTVVGGTNITKAWVISKAERKLNIEIDSEFVSQKEIEIGKNRTLTYSYTGSDDAEAVVTITPNNLVKMIAKDYINSGDITIYANNEIGDIKVSITIPATQNYEEVSGEYGLEVIKYIKLYFDTQGGEPIASRYVVYTKTYGYHDILPTPVKERNRFAGWYTMPNGEGDKVEDITIVERTDKHTIYAYWNEIPEIESVNVGNRSINSIEIRATATDLDKDELKYTLYLQNKDTSVTLQHITDFVPNANEVIYTFTNLDEYTSYYYWIDVYDGYDKVTSNKAETRTLCSGTGYEDATYCSGTSYGYGTCTECTNGIAQATCNYGKTDLSCTCNSGKITVSCPGPTNLAVSATCKHGNTSAHTYEETCIVCNGTGSYDRKCEHGLTETHTYNATCSCCGGEYENCLEYRMPCTEHGNYGAHYVCNTHGYDGNTSIHCEHGYNVTH